MLRLMRACGRAGSSSDRLNESFPMVPRHTASQLPVCIFIHMSIHMSTHTSIYMSVQVPFFSGSLFWV